jgi:hypothetical protein
MSFQTKVIGPILLAKHFASRMPSDGSFVLFSGSSARKPAIGMLAVGATNAAADAVARTLAVELAPIRVNAISPGTIDTGAYDGLGTQRKTALFAARTEQNPARRIGTSEDVAAAVVFALTNTSCGIWATTGSASWDTIAGHAVHTVSPWITRMPFSGSLSWMSFPSATPTIVPTRTSASPTGNGPSSPHRRRCLSSSSTRPRRTWSTSCSTRGPW